MTALFVALLFSSCWSWHKITSCPQSLNFNFTTTQIETRESCFWSQSARAFVAYTVTFPKNYRGDQIRSYPYVIYLHGRDKDHWDFRNNFGESALNAAQEFYGNSPFIVVSPAEPQHSYWKDGLRDSDPTHWAGTATMISRDLVRHIESQRSIQKRRCLTGISMGGHGTTFLKFKEPKIFPHAYAIAPIFRSAPGTDGWNPADTHYAFDYFGQDPVRLFLSARNPCSGFRAEIATDDFFLAPTEPVHPRTAFTKMSFTCPGHVKIAGTGGHDLPFFRPALERALHYCGNVFDGIRN